MMSFGAINRLFTVHNPFNLRCSHLKTFSGHLQRFRKYNGLNRTLKSVEKSDELYREDQYHIAENDDIEVDFPNLHQAHYQFERETDMFNEKRDLKIAERKFFKTKKQPNLLTWEEKEQIRYLHTDDSEEWTVSKLSESFPASEETIKKIIKAKWNMSDPNKIRKHNETVKKNWDLLKEDKLEINENLKKHILKFTSRKRAVLPQPVCVPPPNLLPEGGEFGSIITEYQKKKEKTEVESSTQIVKTSYKSLPPSKDDTFVLGGKNNFNESRHPYKSLPPSKDDTFVLDGKNNFNESRHPVTLDMLRRNINQRIDDGKETSLIDLTIVENVKPNESSSCPAQNFSEKRLHNSPGGKDEKYISSRTESSAITLEHSMKTETDLVPFRIRIPKRYWVRGATYKVEDRYYDYDGTFLYRVPGMK